MNMLNLMETFGKKYKITMDESWAVERQRKEEEKIWYYEIVGRLGTVYPHSETHCAFELTPRTWKKMQAVTLPYTIKKHRECDEGPTLLIENDDVSMALRWIRPRKKRTLSPEQKAKAVARLKKYAFSSARQNDSGGEI